MGNGPNHAMPPPQKTEEVRTSNGKVSSSSDDDNRTIDNDTKIAYYEHQIQANLQHLELERQSRLVAEARAQELEQELMLTKRQLEQFQVPHLAALHERRTLALERYKEEYENDPKNQNPGRQHTFQLRSDAGEDEIDGPT